MKKIKSYLMRNKEGAIFGALIGYFLAFIYTKVLNGADLTFVVQSQGVVDNLLTSIATPHFVYVKLALFSILVGALAGMIIDENVRWL